jgi:hypothetical protein
MVAKCVKGPDEEDFLDFSESEEKYMLKFLSLFCILATFNQPDSSVHSLAATEFPVL